ncbi:MAG: hypothetical protein ACYDHM_15720, partial [Acidiferrobacterales bacterium]
FQGLQQLGTGNQVEKIHRVDLPRAAANLSDLLLGCELGITMTQGWPSWLWMLLGNNIVSTLAVSLLYKFQSVTSPSIHGGA